MVLPAGSTLPPFPQGTVVVVSLLAVVWGLRRDGVTITDRTVLALAPWMVAGATAHVVYQLEVLPPILAPFFGSPTVYGTTFAVAGVLWLAFARGGESGDLSDRGQWWFGGAGALFAVVPTAIALWVGTRNGGLAPLVPLAGVLVAAVLAWLTWTAFESVRPTDATAVGLAGPVVVFGHALDGVSTALGVDWVGFGERSPVSRFVLNVGEALPTADLLGTGWVFVLVKLVVAAAVVSLMAGYVRDDPTGGYGLLAFVAAVGLGPGAHNVLLFVVLAPTAF
ncbi:MAG: DUF63 family protein [Halanaeroarchaeum sp.]